MRLSFGFALFLSACIQAPPDSLGDEMDGSVPVADMSGATDFEGRPDDGPAPRDTGGSDVGPPDVEVPDLAGDASDAAEDDVGEPAPPCDVAEVPFGRWAMDQTVGDAVPNTGRGSFEGLKLTGAKLEPGRVGSHLRTTGNSLVTPHVPDSAAFDLDSGTVSFWVNPDDTTSNSGLVSRDALNQNTNGHFTVELVFDQVQFRLQELVGESPEIRSTAKVRAGEWNHVAVTWTNGAMALFVHGVRDVWLAKGWSIAGNDNPMAVGYSSGRSSDGSHLDGINFFSGGIDEVTIWDRVLADDEIAALAVAGCTTASN